MNNQETAHNRLEAECNIDDHVEHFYWAHFITLDPPYEILDIFETDFSKIALSFVRHRAGFSNWHTGVLWHCGFSRPQSCFTLEHGQREYRYIIIYIPAFG